MELFAGIKVWSLAFFIDDASLLPRARSKMLTLSPFSESSPSPSTSLSPSLYSVHLYVTLQKSVTQRKTHVPMSYPFLYSFAVQYMNLPSKFSYNPKRNSRQTRHLCLQGDTCLPLEYIWLAWKVVQRKSVRDK